MKKFLFVFMFLITTPVTLPLAILWLGFDLWRVLIEDEGKKAIGGMKE